MVEVQAEVALLFLWLKAGVSKFVLEHHGLVGENASFHPARARLVVSRIRKSKAGKRQCWQGFLQLSTRYGKTGASRKLDTPSIYVALSGKHRNLLQIDGNLETPA
jgi:hypothetical protein